MSDRGRSPESSDRKTRDSALDPKGQTKVSKPGSPAPQDKAVASSRRVSLPVLGAGGQPQRAVDKASLGEEAPVASTGGWVLLGVVSNLLVLFLLSMVTVFLFRAVYGTAPNPRAGVLLVILSATSIAVASLVSGYVVGRFGGQECKARHGLYAGLLSGLLLWALSKVALGIAIVVITALCSYAGGKVGLRARRAPT